MIIRSVQSIVIKFLDDGAKQKVRLLGKNYQSELLKLINADNLPQEFGGRLESLNV